MRARRRRWRCGALRGHALGGTGEPIEVESRDDQTRLPVALHLDPAALVRELDAVGNRLLHARRRGERLPLAQERHGGVVERAAVPSAAAVGQHPDVEAVPVRMEARRPVIHVDGADDAAVLLGDDARLEEPAVVPVVILMARFLDGPGVVRIAEVAAGHPGRVVVLGERAQARGGGRHWSRESIRRAASANVI